MWSEIMLWNINLTFDSSIWGLFLHYKRIHWRGSSISINSMQTGQVNPYEIQYSLLALRDDVHHMRRWFSGFSSVVELSHCHREEQVRESTLSIYKIIFSFYCCGTKQLLQFIVSCIFFCEKIWRIRKENKE